ncbi:MAG: four-helix bundle copper-binding protein [Sphingomonadaceae bacterium]|nr:four-helix bundle copper-binding protein [Sphingomonadaceae bacterium]
MSISRIMAAHPDAGGANEALGLAVRHAMFCAAICTACADADSAEAMDMRQCARTCLDCADICAATARVAIRQSGSNATVVRAMLETCVAACETCAEECDRHEHEHCRLCAEMCRECARDCRAALDAL